MDTDPREPSVDCAGCRYWHTQHYDVAFRTVAECRRGPPAYGEHIVDSHHFPWRIFPVTASSDWCGEFAAREGE